MLATSRLNLAMFDKGLAKFDPRLADVRPSLPTRAHLGQSMAQVSQVRPIWDRISTPKATCPARVGQLIGKGLAKGTLGEVCLAAHG